MNPSHQDATTVGYFDRQSQGWTERYGRDGYFRDRHETVVGWLKDAKPGSRLLDYGCGSGVLLAAMGQVGHQVTGVDVSAGMLVAARRTLEEAGVPEALFHLEQAGDDFKGRYLDQTYNIIITVGVIEYLDRPMDLLRLLIDRLEPRGVLIVSFPNRSSVLRKWERFVFHYPSLFRLFGLFPHLTGPDAYLNFQKHQFVLKEIEQFFQAGGLCYKRVHYHVAPGVPQGWSGHPAFGMTVIAEFCRL